MYSFMLSILEIRDIILMTLATGYIFMDMFKPPSSSDDPVEAYRQQSDFKKRFLYSVSLVAPAIILHEFGHKFVAMSMGLDATFHAAYTFLAIGVVLKMVNFPILIVVPAYIRTVGAAPEQTILIAAAGPLVNLVLYFLSWYMRKQSTQPQKIMFWRYSQYINGFLAVFNFLPIPGFDGYLVFSRLLTIL